VLRPCTAAVDASRVAELRARAAREVDAGLLPSCQFALALGGELVAFEALGTATTETRYVIFSCTKPLVAATVWTLMGEGAVDVDRRVAEDIPEFATNGKDVVTIEQVMLHTSGFPHAPLGPPAWDTRGGRLEAFGRWRLNWEPGTGYEYHATSAHWVLAELIERATGQHFADAVHQRVVLPTGLPRRVLALAADDQDGIAPLEVRGEPATAEEVEAVLGVPGLPVSEVTDEALLSFGRPEIRAVGVPGGGGVMTAADLALWYQAVLHDPDGIWDPAVLADATGRVRNRFPDPVLGVPANRTLGLELAGDDGRASMRGFGKTASSRTFGHGGAGGQIAWADPVSGLSFAYLTNGLDANPLRAFRRGVALSSLAGSCAPAS
jgi:CubicO group peptidase (beta-lactamase class C family)